MKKIKITKLDAIFSKCVRERAGWVCERCLKYFPEGPGRGGLHCSHHYSRRHMSVRCHPNNASSHCAGCHSFLGSNPIVFAGWIQAKLGQERFDELMMLKETPCRLREKDKREMFEHFKSELARMQSERDGGKQGYLEFDPWFPPGWEMP